MGRRYAQDHVLLGGFAVGCGFGAVLTGSSGVFCMSTKASKKALNLVPAALAELGVPLVKSRLAAIEATIKVRMISLH